MDPNAKLKELRELAAAAIEGEGQIEHDNAKRMAELFQALDEWLSKRGLLPLDWRIKGIRR